MIPLEQRIAALEAQVKALTSFTTIPYDIDKAFRNRLGIDRLKATESATDPTTVVRAVNEAGVSSYNVMKNPDGLLQITPADGFAVDVPYFIQ